MKLEKEYSVSTLMSMRKEDLVDLVQTLSFNNNALYECICNQADYMEKVFKFASKSRGGAKK